MGKNEAGWSLGKSRPGLKQEEYFAKRYNIKQLDFDYVVDTLISIKNLSPSLAIILL